MERKNIIIIAAAVVFFLIVGTVLIFSGSLIKTKPVKYAVDLEVWGLFDDRDAFTDIFDSFQKTDPNVRRINYKKLTVDTYKKELVEALASGQGPDIFIIHNTWLPSFQDKLAPAPNTIINEQKFKNEFVDVAAQDFVSGGKIYAVPLSVDSLALYYNKDLFNNAGIALPPVNWEQFMEDSRKLTAVDETGTIVRSGVALGTAQNINRPTDILSLLMIQQGSAMNIGDRVSFNNKESKSALTFYTEFAKTSSPLYSWNSRMHNSLDAFSEGRLAMMFNYSWQIDVIKKKSPKLNFGVAAFPQVPNKLRVNYANYWGYGVSKNKIIQADPTTANDESIAPTTDAVRVAEAWKLLKFMAAKAGATDYVVDKVQMLDPKYDAAAAYAEKTGKPSARRDIIETQKADPTIGVFAEQNLFAKSWKQFNPELIEGMMAQMITRTVNGEQTADEALRSAESQINQALGQ